jgi:hypothetical protein
LFTISILQILQGHGYRFFSINDAAMTIEQVDEIAPGFENGAPDMTRLNRLASKKLPNNLILG